VVHRLLRLLQGRRRDVLGGAESFLEHGD
jgi:hypothetical protein